MIRSQAKKKLQSLPRPERFRVAEKIVQLGCNPDDETLDIKKIEGKPYFRLRVGNWHVIFDRQDAVKIIAVEKIKPRGDAYK
ncbi:type II toxin-antitoxin system RelE family toxin [Nitrosomonas marina]|uniref:mRNA interferase RelE/StbE n=1 Tax=Nitrosomonas marina TaxID=917 RepID=A0A1H8IJ61_9PROT|nr:plasmid stabilization protein [Nitrosomonas marina]SEN68342.1 mRNA interferase RelE/StbE [Nitrosomonas marina]